jgi:hypothetical protein
MLSLYYRIWVDAITYQKKKQKKEDGWELLTIISISILQGLNLLAILFVFRWLTHRQMPIMLPMRIFHMSAFNGFCSVVLIFFLPFILLNYLLIFYNQRYQKLLSIYPNKNGKLYRNYLIVTVGVIVVPMVFKILFL